MPRLTLAAALLLPTPALAQRPMLTVYTVGDGLPSGGVRELTQDASGRTWFLSRGRVTVYDGSEFSVQGAAQGLPSVHFSALALDARGRVLAALRDEPRIYRQGGRGEAWRELAVPAGDARSAGRNTALAVASLGGRERIVLGTAQGGLRLFDGQAWSAIAAGEGLPAGPVTALATLASAVAVGTPGGLCRLEASGLDCSWRERDARLRAPILALAASADRERLFVLTARCAGVVEHGRLTIVADGLDLDSRLGEAEPTSRAPSISERAIGRSSPTLTMER